MMQLDPTTEEQDLETLDLKIQLLDALVLVVQVAVMMMIFSTR